MEVRWTEVAARDLESLVEFIARDSDATAADVAEKIVDAADELARFPQRGRVVPELRAIGFTSHRELVRRPWRIICRVADEAIFVVAVVDGRRNVGDILFDRLVDDRL